jgi:RNA polymerase sigma-70 factor (ECF subfamily)
VTQPAPQPEPDDATLIARWQAGDQAAATELVRRHARAVAGFLGASGAGEDVDDLVQEAFFRAFRYIDRFRGGSTFRTWVMTIAGNALTDLRRRHGRRAVVSLGDMEIPDGAADPHRETVERDLLARVERQVALLPPMQRNVFLLRAHQGLEYDEIARVLDTSPGAARVHYHHAVKRLKAVVEG